MPTHDIIDNRNERLVEHINRILPSSGRVRFAVGYFFLSGLTPISEQLARVPEIRLLIGNTTDRETLEQLVEGYRRLDLVEERLEGQRFAKRTAQEEASAATAVHLREALEIMDQTDDGEALVNALSRLIAERRMQVKVYTKGRLHSKAYIFDFARPNPGSNGIAIVGSSNLSLAGLSHNTELNVYVHDNGRNHEVLTRWFDELWNEARDFEAPLMEEMRQSWAAAPVRPYDIYMKTLYTLVRDRLEEGEDAELLWDDEIIGKLADFQKAAVRQAAQIVRDSGGCFVSDVVGLGKTYIGAALVKHFERTEGARALIICPPALSEMWERYNEVYRLNAQVLSIGKLQENNSETERLLGPGGLYKDRDFVLVDESHNFRHSDTQRYRVLQNFLAIGKKCVLVTATPRNKSAWDVYHQIKLFHQEDKTDIPVDPPDLKRYFKAIERGEKRLPDLLAHVLIRRTRRHVLRWYGFAADTQKPLAGLSDDEARPYLSGDKPAYILVGGRHQSFPKRELETIAYNIDDTYQGLYEKIRGSLGRPRKSPSDKSAPDELTYARYGLWHYVLPEKQKAAPYSELHRAGVNLRGLVRVMLFKRFESSVHAFRETLGRLLRIHERFLEALRQGMVPAGEEAQALMYEAEAFEEEDLYDELRAATGRYRIEDFDIERLVADISKDVGIIGRLLELVRPITPDRDAKLQTLLAKLKEPPLSDGKRLIFTQYADTARYLFENLNPGGKEPDIDVISSADKSKARVVGRFAPRANPENAFYGEEGEIQTLIATDVLSEGLNLQDCNKVLNYDLHWNPVRLIQRFGRIDRIGSEHSVVYGFNFLPEAKLDRNLGLRATLERRIREIHETIGEDAAILDNSEKVNEEAMYAIYEKKGVQLSLFEDEGEAFMDLNEAEEVLRQLRRENRAEYERIANLRDGIRAAKKSEGKKLYVFCQSGRYQQLILADPDGTERSRDIPHILGLIKADPEAAGDALPAGFNSAVMKVKRGFEDEVRHRKAEKAYSTSLTHGQRYVLRELQMLFKVAEDEERKAQIARIEQAFRAGLTAGVSRELTRLRRNAVVGEALFKKLVDLYLQHDMASWAERRSLESERKDIPRIVCSMALG